MASVLFDEDFSYNYTSHKFTRKDDNEDKNVGDI